MEIVGRPRAVGDDHVDVSELLDGELLLDGREVLGVVGAQLQEPLGPGGRVLGSHALHAVGQEHDEAGLADPLGLAARDELVDDALRRVGEVAELRLPDDQRVGIGHGVAELETEHAVLRQGGVGDAVGGLVGVEVCQGVVGRPVLGLVVEDVVPVREGAALDVLPRESDVDALLHEGAEGHGLAKSPVDCPVLDHLLSALEDSHHGAVDDEVLSIGRPVAELVPDAGQSLLVDAGGAELKGVLALEESRPGRVEPVLVIDLLLLLRLLVGLLTNLFVLVNDLLDLFLGHGAFLDELFRVDVEDVGVLLDDAVHDGLGEHGFVDLVVAVLPVAHQVDDDVLVEGGAVLCGDPAHEQHGLGVVRVHVENGSVHNAADIRAVRRGPGVPRVGGEANLVVGHNVHRAPETRICSRSKIHMQN